MKFLLAAATVLVPTLAQNTVLTQNVRTLVTFPQGTWLENIAATNNGSLLVSEIGVANLHFINPLAKPATSKVLTTFPNANAVFGISELEPDVFAVAVGSTTPDFQPVPGSYSMWKIDLRAKKLTVSKIADVPNIGLINGVQATNPNTVLLADSIRGNIVKLDTRSKAYEVVLEHPSLLPNFTAQVPLGVNGLKLSGSTLFYSNTVQRLLGRVPINTSTGRATGAFKVFASGQQIKIPDDFDIGKDGNLYVASPSKQPDGDTLQRVTQNGQAVTLAEGGAVRGATAARFGRTSTDQKTVYLSTMGGFGPDGLPNGAGKVVAVTVS